MSYPTLASAAEEPTSGERKGIERAAHREYAEPGAKVSVSDIKVSTKNPHWATAVVAVRYTGTQKYQAQFYRPGGGSWTGTSGRTMPEAVEDDLGLGDSEPFPGIYGMVYLWICWFFGLAGTVDVLLQPRRAFKAAGHSKALWFAIQALGAVLVGIFTWAAYALFIRPSVVRAGGREPRKLTKAFLASLPSTSSTPPTRPTPSPGAGSQQPPKTRVVTCTACIGGTLPCGNCGNNRRVDYRRPDGVLDVRTCPACGGGKPCPKCRGTGSVEVPA